MIRTSGGSIGEYYFGSNQVKQRFTVTVPDEWSNKTYTLTDGGIKIGGYGGSFGSHRSTTYMTGKEVNTNASGAAGVAAVLPDVVIPVYVVNDCEHEWKNATCTTPKKCGLCGETMGDVDPTAHNYVDGTCEYCGEDYDTTIPVVLLTATNYNNTSNPSTIDLAEIAISGIAPSGEMSGIEVKNGKNVLPSYREGTIYLVPGTYDTLNVTLKPILGAGMQGNKHLYHYLIGDTRSEALTTYTDWTYTTSVTPVWENNKTSLDIQLVLITPDGAVISQNVKYTIHLEIEESEEPTTYTVTLPTGTGYTVAATEGSASPVTEGGSYSFTVTIAEGYEAGADFAVKANEATLTPVDGVYTIENITAAQTVTVEGIVSVDKAAAAAVEEKIAAIGEVTLEKESAITEARSAYDALTDEQKALVGNLSVLEAAEKALEELKTPTLTWQQVMEKTEDYLTALAENKAPIVSSTKGEWLVLGLARNGMSADSDIFKGYYDNVVRHVEENVDPETGRIDKNRATENARVILALTALGKDVTDVAGHNLLQGLSDTDFVKKQGINGPVWTLIALDSHDYEIPTNADSSKQVTREWLIDYILENQLEGGGWKIQGETADDMTPMAVQALAPYYNSDPEVKTAVDKALTIMEGMVETGSPETLAQIIVARSTMGLDSEEIVNKMLAFALEDGSFKKSPSANNANQMSTEQAFYSMVAYSRFLNNKTDLYDMSDVVIETPSEQEKPVESVTLSDSTLSIKVGKTATLVALVSPADATNRTVSWTTSNTSVATVSSNGVVTAVAEGSAIITATAGEKSASCIVTVTKESSSEPKLEFGLTEDEIVGYVTISFEDNATRKSAELSEIESEFRSPLGTIIRSTRVPFKEGDTIASVTLRLLNEKEFTASYEGDEYGSFYLEAIGNFTAKGHYYSSFGEFDAGRDSGWMITWNGWFIDQGASEFEVKNGDVVRWQYTCQLGADIGDVDWSDDNPSTTPNNKDDEVKVPISSDKSTIHVDATVDGSKVTVDEVDFSNLNTVIDNHVETGTVTIDFSALDSDKPITTVEIPAAAVKQIAEAVNDPANDAHSLEIVLSDGVSIEFDAAALKEKASQANGADITISIEHHENAALTNAQKDTVGNRPAFDINVTSGGKHISDMGGKITIHAPYELKSGEKARGILVWYVDDHGNKERCVTSYDPIKKRVNWKTDHLSLYMIDYDETLANNPFTDVTMDNYYFDAVLWAVDEGITNGTSDTTFSPDASCTRAQMVTFLWRAAGSPKATVTTCTFADVDKDAYYYEALLWAVENGITNGTSDTTFSPDASCTRGQMATFLYRNAKTPSVSGSHDFTDVKADAYYNDAVIWAADQKITNGTSDTTFSPDADCTRGQMVTFLYRYLAE